MRREVVPGLTLAMNHKAKMRELVFPLPQPQRAAMIF
jgi:hypothetical protein